MKRISIIAMALTLILGLSQCKKGEQPAPTNGSEAVIITLDLKSNGGTRMDVNTTTGEVTYQSGDVVYVASGGHYIGTLTYNGTNFTGAITDPIVGEPLHFYFLGNVTPVETLAAGTTTTCSVVISDQAEHLPVIEYAPSNETYISGLTTFTALLLNKCALAKFNVITSSEAATCVTGFNNLVTVDFTDAAFTYSQTNGGSITLPAGGGAKWAILLPQEAMEAGEVGSAYSIDGAYTGTCGAVPAIVDNGFLTTGIDVNVTTEVYPGEVPVGAICGKFTINADGDQVYFSQGNLQYIGSAATPYWKFADNQWDYFGTTTGQNSSSQNVDRDLFGWGTSGWHDNSDLYNICYQPWASSQTNTYSDYNPYGYGPSTNMASLDLRGSSANYDWGVYNPINNGGNIANQWRTLTSAEWGYVLSNRTTSSGIHFARAKVNGVKGMILLPDDWDASYFELNNTNIINATASYDSNTISITQWNSLEQYGVVFLPAAGLRYGPSLLDVSHDGDYWTATPSSTAYSAECVYFYEFSYRDAHNHRYVGHSVRLVCDVE